MASYSSVLQPEVRSPFLQNLLDARIQFFSSLGGSALSSL